MLDLNQHYYTEGLLCHGQILLFPFTERTERSLACLSYCSHKHQHPSYSDVVLGFFFILLEVFPILCLGFFFLTAEQLNLCVQRAILSLPVCCIWS